MWRILILILMVGLIMAGPFAVTAKGADPAWDDIERRARGDAVYFNAWGGDPAVNRYLEWAGERVLERHAIRLVHVKVTDIAEAVSRLTAERSVGREQGGSVDLLWINGENFAMLKERELLFGPWADRLPNASLIDWQGNPTTRIDFTVSTEGFELPWGTSVFTLFYDRQNVDEPPRNPAGLLAWIESNPGRFSYPQPPAFVGTAFLKQLLLSLADVGTRLQRPVAGDFDIVTAPLWAWLDRAHLGMWRQGRLFPASGPAQRELVASGELDWLMSYSPAEASRAIHHGELPTHIGGYHLPGGALANSHFLAIPWNARARDAAMVVANFLLSPEAQARKADERIWGDLSVLDLDRLEPAERSRFRQQRAGEATPARPERIVPEPHASWSTRLEQAWLERYTR